MALGTSSGRNIHFYLLSSHHNPVFECFSVSQYLHIANSSLFPLRVNETEKLSPLAKSNLHKKYLTKFPKRMGTNRDSNNQHMKTVKYMR